MTTRDPEIWTADPDRVLWVLGTNPGGLTEREAAIRLRHHGPNAMPERSAVPLPRALAAQLVHSMALLLWVAGALAIAAGMPELGWAIWGVVVLNAAFAFLQEVRAERALAALAEVLPRRARAIRDGVTVTIAACDVAPGDRIELLEGDQVPADARLIEANGLLLDLAALTGESAAVPRHSSRTADGARSLVELENLALAGSTVMRGRAQAVVFATGADTELGRIASLTARVQRGKSTLELEVHHLIRVVTAVALAMGAAVFLLSIAIVGIDPQEAFLLAIGIIVANVPEGLLPTVTLALSISVQRMARRNALVRRLSAIETLSATSVICTDKTGTLTTSHMEVGTVVSPSPRLLLKGATLCSNAHPTRSTNGPAGGFAGDPTEVALLRAAFHAGLSPERLRARHRRVHEMPFDPWRRRMTVLVRHGPRHLWLWTKGGLEDVLPRCTTMIGPGGPEPLSPEAAERIVRSHDALARAGQRVLAFAVSLRPADALEPSSGSREAGESPGESSAADENGLTFVGIAGLLDPPRPQAATAIRACREAGIRVTMLTGDHELTARAIAEAVGLWSDKTRLVTGAEISGLDLNHLLAEHPEVVFARVSPEQKLEIVRAYQALGHVVAATGDGVNDAPALRAANIGFAMGASGTDVAREAADVVLLDDDFSTIVSAVEEGRAIFANIRRFMTYILASNVPEIVPFVTMVAAKIPAALSVLQILAVDLGTDMGPALGLGAERPEPGVMQQPPRALRRPLLDKAMLLRSYLFLGVIEATLSMGAFFHVWARHGVSFAELRILTPEILSGRAPDAVATYHQATTAALMAIVACQLGNVLACRSERASVFRSALGSNRLLLLGIGVELLVAAAILWVPALSSVFGVAPLEAADWLWIAMCPVVLLTLEELRKAIARLTRRRSSSGTPRARVFSAHRDRPASAARAPCSHAATTPPAR